MAVRKKVAKTAASKVKAKKPGSKAAQTKKAAKASPKTASKAKAKKKAVAKPAAKKKTSKKVASKVSGKKKPAKKTSSKAASKPKLKKQAVAKPTVKKNPKKKVVSKAIPRKKTSVTKKAGRKKASAQPIPSMSFAPSRVFSPRSTPRTPKKGGLAQPELETLSAGDTFGPSTPMDPKVAAEALRAAFAVESPFNLQKSKKRSIAKEGEPGYGFAVAARAAADEVINAVLGELGAIGEFDEID